MTTTVHLPCDSCGEDVTALAEYLAPVTLCGACTPDQWDGASLPAEEFYADFMLDLLNEDCGPLIDDDVTGVLDPEIAVELRARIRKAAAA